MTPSPSMLHYRKMIKILVTALLLSLLNHGTGMATMWDDKDFFKYCPPSRCSKQGPEIRYPYRLESSNTSSTCGAPCMNLACSGQDTILARPDLGPCKVTAIDYKRAVLKIVPLVNSLSPCPLQKLFSTSPPIDVEGPCASFENDPVSIVRCAREFTPNSTVQGNAADRIVGPISCLSNASHFSYLVHAYMSMSVLPLYCEGVSNGVIRIPSSYDGSTFKERAERILNFAETTISWTGNTYNSIPDNCTRCERAGRLCAFSSQSNQTFCMRHGIKLD